MMTGAVGGWDEKPAAFAVSSRRNVRGAGKGASRGMASREDSDREDVGLVEAVVAGENMAAAYLRVERNKGSAVVDRVRMGELRSYVNGR